LFDEAARSLTASPDLAGALLGRAGLRERRWRFTQRPSDYEAAINDYEASLHAAERRSPIAGVGVALASGVLAVSKGDRARAVQLLRRGLRLLDVLLPRQVLRVDQRAWHRQAEDLIAASAVVIAEEEGAAAAAAVVRSYYRREARMLEAAGRLAAADSDRSEQLRRRLVDWLHLGTGEEPPSDSPVDKSSGIGPGQAGDPGEDEATMVMVVASDVGGVLIVTGRDREARCRLLPRVGSQDVRRRVQALHRVQLRLDRNAKQLDRLLDRLGSWMYAELAVPLTELVPDAEAVCLLACGSLAQLPLAGAVRVRDGSSEYPMLTRPVRYLSRRSARWEPREVVHGIVLLGDLDPGGSSSSERVATARRLGLAEAEGLGLVCETRTVDGTGVSLSVVDEFADADVVHFACHGISHPSDAANSRILLGRERSLTVGDLLHAPLEHGPLVFLASCDTGRPDPTLPDQTFGIVEALLYAGAQAVIAPAGPVSRLASVTVSTRVYDGIRLGRTPDEALADAQRWLVTASDPQIRAWLESSASAFGRQAHQQSSLAWLAQFFAGQSHAPSRALRRADVLSFATWA
jgi:hypothetical protein